MYRWQRSALSKPGKFIELAQMAQEVTSYLKTNYSEINIQAFVQMFGDVGTVYWVSEYDNLDALADFNIKSLADENFLALANKVDGLVVDGGIKDALMRSL